MHPAVLLLLPCTFPCTCRLLSYSDMQCLWCPSQSQWLEFPFGGDESLACLICAILFCSHLQGVYELYDVVKGGDWALAREGVRQETRLVLIGRHLDHKALQVGWVGSGR